MCEFTSPDNEPHAAHLLRGRAALASRQGCFKDSVLTAAQQAAPSSQPGKRRLLSRGSSSNTLQRLRQDSSQRLRKAVVPPPHSSLSCFQKL